MTKLRSQNKCLFLLGLCLSFAGYAGRCDLALHNLIVGRDGEPLAEQSHERYPTFFTRMGRLLAVEAAALMVRDKPSKVVGIFAESLRKKMAAENYVLSEVALTEIAHSVLSAVRAKALVNADIASMLMEAAVLSKTRAAVSDAAHPGRRARLDFYLRSFGIAEEKFLLRERHQAFFDAHPDLEWIELDSDRIQLTSLEPDQKFPRLYVDRDTFRVGNIRSAADVDAIEAYLATLKTSTFEVEKAKRALSQQNPGGYEAAFKLAWSEDAKESEPNPSLNRIYTVQVEAAFRLDPPIEVRGMMIDLSTSYVNVPGNGRMRFIFSEDLKPQHLNAPGKASVVNVTGHLLELEDGETVFVITEIETIGLQG